MNQSKTTHFHSHSVDFLVATRRHGRPLFFKPQHNQNNTVRHILYALGRLFSHPRHQSAFICGFMFLKFILSYPWNNLPVDRGTARWPSTLPNATSAETTSAFAARCSGP